MSAPNPKRGSPPFPEVEAAVGGSNSPDVRLAPWERIVTGMDTGSGDDDCMVIAVYSALTGKLQIVDVEWQQDQLGDQHGST
jgi:hypothetical protein